MRFAPVGALASIAVLAVGCESHPTAQDDATGLLASTASTGSVIEVSPTGTPIDLENVRAAVNAAQPGDVVRLTTGTFDFSLAYKVYHSGPSVDNLLCLRSHITIEGEPGTIIRGPGRDFPNDPVDGYSEPFTGGGWGSGGLCPPYDHVTIRNLTIREFTRGLGVGFYDLSPSEAIPTEGVRILANTFEEIYMGVVAGGLVGSEITGNTFREVTHALHWLSGRSHDVGPSDTKFSKNEVSADDRCILIAVYGFGNPAVLRGLQIIGNRLSGYYGGVWVGAGDPLIAGNEIETHGVGIAFTYVSGEESHSVANATVRANRIRLVEPLLPGRASIILDHGAHHNLIVGNPILGMQGELADIFLSSSTHDNVVREPSPVLLIIDNGTDNYVTGSK